MKLTKIISILRRIAPLVALLAMVNAAVAQTTASLSGKVQDTTGALVSSAHVVLTNNASKDKRELDSNSAGFFTFAGLIPGTYTVEISASGFRSLRREAITVNPG